MDRPIRHRRTAAKVPAHALPQFKAAPSKNIHRLQDAVYREMYLLEAQEPGAEMGLALALLRVVVASEPPAIGNETRTWLKDVCSICLKMIENALQSHSHCSLSGQS